MVPVNEAHARAVEEIGDLVGAYLEHGVSSVETKVEAAPWVATLASVCQFASNEWRAIDDTAAYHGIKLSNAPRAAMGHAWQKMSVKDRMRYVVTFLNLGPIP